MDRAAGQAARDRDASNLPLGKGKPGTASPWCRAGRGVEPRSKGLEAHAPDQLCACECISSGHCHHPCQKAGVALTGATWPVFGRLAEAQGHADLSGVFLHWPPGPASRPHLRLPGAHYFLFGSGSPWLLGCPPGCK